MSKLHILDIWNLLYGNNTLKLFRRKAMYKRTFKYCTRYIGKNGSKTCVFFHSFLKHTHRHMQLKWFPIGEREWDERKGIVWQIKKATQFLTSSYQDVESSFCPLNISRFCNCFDQQNLVEVILYLCAGLGLKRKKAFSSRSWNIHSCCPEMPCKKQWLRGCPVDRKPKLVMYIVMYILYVRKRCPNSSQLS